jgi:hypothetical protein
MLTGRLSAATPASRTYLSPAEPRNAVCQGEMKRANVHAAQQHACSAAYTIAVHKLTARGTGHIAAQPARLHALCTHCLRAAKPSQAKPSQAKPSQAKPSRGQSPLSGCL